MQIEYSNALRHQPHLHSLAQNCELEIRDVFNDLISVEVSFEPTADNCIRARLEDVGKATEVIFSEADLQDERQTALKLKAAWASLFETK